MRAANRGGRRHHRVVAHALFLLIFGLGATFWHSHCLPLNKLAALPIDTVATKIVHPDATTPPPFAGQDMRGAPSLDALVPAYHRPPLSTLVNATHIVGDVQFLLDFAHIGFTKTASTTMSNWLDAHPDVAMLPGEPNWMRRNHAVPMITLLYESLPAQAQRRGYKNPDDISSVHALTLLARHFPRTKLIIGIRHPILWYESFYNYCVAAKCQITFPSPAKVMQASPTSCDTKNLMCLLQGNVHVHLYRLGKTSSAPSEQSFFQFDGQLWKHWNATGLRLPNPIFLYDIHQIGDRNATRAATFRDDLQSFLDLASPLAPPSRVNVLAASSKALHICDTQYASFRRMVLVNAAQASRWIRQCFLASPDVHVAAPDYFHELLLSWEHDPCEKSNYSEGIT